MPKLAKERSPKKSESVKKISLSMVIPLYNEEESLPLFHNSLTKLLEEKDYSYEIIYVNDGSTDNTSHLLEEITSGSQKVKGIELRRNFGQTAATAAGIHFSRGDIIVTMDGDLQNDPKDIPRVIEKLKEGFDVVSGWRKERKDQFLTRVFPSRVANIIISLFTGVRLHDYGCTLKAYRTEIVKGLRLYGELHRFIPVLAHIEGASIAEIEVSHHPRTTGKSKYNLWRIPGVVLDLMVVSFLKAFIDRPFRIFGVFGFLTGISGVAIRSSY